MKRGSAELSGSFVRYQTRLFLFFLSTFLTFQRVRKGYRLNEPIYPLNRTVNGEIFQLMKDCWNKDKYARPEFSEIKERLKRLEPRLLERDLNQQNPHYQPR